MTLPGRATGGQVGKEAWGAEIELRSEIYLEMRERFQAPTVLVVVQGGPGTLKTVRGGLNRGIPTVLVGGSGGAADLLLEWIATPAEREGLRLEEITSSERLKRDKYYKTVCEKLGNEWLDQLKALVKERVGQISFIDLSNANKEDIDNRILGAVREHWVAGGLDDVGESGFPASLCSTLAGGRGLLWRWRRLLTGDRHLSLCTGAE